MIAPRSVIHPEHLAAMVDLARQTPAGCFVEVGVYRGGSAWWLATVSRKRGEKLHLFDTFTGMPFADAVDQDAIGSFGDTTLSGVLAAIPDAVFHVGVFPETLTNLGKIAFVHCDCDQYRSVAAVIRELWPRLVPGGIVVFDDVDTPGGRRAISEAGIVLSEYRARMFARKT
jgi:O-methyltransferase